MRKDIEMEKTTLEICCGTACYMLGASELMKIEELLPQEWLEHLEIRGIPCLDACSDDALGGAPFVRLDGEMVSNATCEKVFALIGEKLSAKGLI